MKRIVSLFFLLLIALGLTASAAPVTAQLRPDITIVIDGYSAGFRDVNGTAVYPILYEGTTYLPIRAIGNIMGKEVDWINDTCTVALSGTAPSVLYNRPESRPAVSTVQPQLRPDITILIDGVARTFYDVNGKQVYPLLYQGTTYLPIRAIGNIMGKSVEWVNDSTTILFGDVPTEQEGYVGTALGTDFFAVTLHAAQRQASYGGHAPSASDRTFLVLDVTIENTSGRSLPVFSSDFAVTSPSLTGEEVAYEKILAEQLDDALTLAPGQSVRGKLVMEAPAGDSRFALTYTDYYDDGTVGDTYRVLFAA